MKCSFCGNEVEEGAKFCPVCGTEVTSANDSERTEGTSRYEDPNGQGGYGYGQGGYGYGQAPAGQNGQFENGQSGYGYGQTNNGQDGYSYGQPDNGQGGYGYGQLDPNQGGYGQPVKQISGTPYLIFSILVTLCCCLPLGIAGIVYASKINSLQKMGDYAGAQEAAKKAKIYMIIGAVVGLIVQIIVGTMGAKDTFADIVSDSGFEALDDMDEDVDEDIDDSDKASQKPAKASKDLGESWKSYTVQINDTVLTFPCSVSDVEATGLTLDTEDTPEDYVINRDDYELVFFEDGNYNSFMFIVVNHSDEAKTVKECTVNGIYVSDYNVEDGNWTIIFPGGIQIGSDIDTVIEKWGETEDVYEGDTYTSYTWYEENNYNYCSVDVDNETGKVTNINLDGEYLE